MEKMNFEFLTSGDLWNLRKEIVLNSCYVSDYENTFGFSAESMCTFFDGYVDYLWELAKEDGFDGFDDAFEDYDNEENLWCWYNCFDDFSWVEYVNDEEEDE